MYYADYLVDDGSPCAAARESNTIPTMTMQTPAANGENVHHRDNNGDDTCISLHHCAPCEHNHCSLWYRVP